MARDGCLGGMIWLGIVGTVCLLPFMIVYGIFYTIGALVGESVGQFLGWAGVIGSILFLLVKFSEWNDRVSSSADQSISNYQEDLQGHFADWWDGQEVYDHPDEMSIRQASAAVLKSYGGAAVIRHLASEGFLQIINDDILNVMGGMRGVRVVEEVVTNMNSGFNLSSNFLGFVTGFVVSRRL